MHTLKYYLLPFTDMSAMMTTTDYYLYIPTFKDRISLHCHLQRIIFSLKEKIQVGRSVGDYFLGDERIPGYVIFIRHL